MEDPAMSWLDYSWHIGDSNFMEGVLTVHQERGISIHQEREDLETLFRKTLYEMDMNRGDVLFLHFGSKIAIMKKGM